ncbi:Asparagine--tRNA ligase, mitochondrial [Golovinomyces cichoracearum]|uniref:asparagine--tRNA ligase n=1 Tax=Golovinomyces cichoracearum TaxID=62708 RepID=A0A420J9Y2_9PEZI|nr:Asparagine--tRNA ligase, mitochondrial [Golovinomyces cichoracearum]
MAYIVKKMITRRFVSVCSSNRANNTRRFTSATLQTSVACLLRQKLDSSEPGDLQADNEVVLNGYIHSIRNQKTRSFAAIGDGSCLQSLQALLTPAQAKGWDSLSFGTAVTVRGSWKKSLNPTGQTHELHVSKLDVVAATDSNFPLQKKYQTPEYLRTIPHLRMRTPFNTTLLRLRSEVIAVITKKLSEMSFIQTHTPIITSSDCEGAGEVFQIGLASKHKSSSGQEFFRSPKYLTVSSQLHLEALAQAVGKVWTLSPAFRAEKSDTSRHLSEFYMLEAEINFADSMYDVMKLIQEILLPVVQTLYSSQIGDEILSRGPLGEKDTKRRWDGISSPWKCITYTDAIKILKSCTHIFDHEPKFGLNLQAEHERYLTNEVGVTSDRASPLFVTHFPRAIKPFYMLPSESNDDGLETVECFDVLVPDLGEMAGGSLREYRLEPLIKSMFMNELIPSNSPSDQDLRDLKWYVDLRKWGCVPHGGFGLGFDRLLGFLAGVANIREMVTFPRWVGRCDC